MLELNELTTFDRCDIGLTQPIERSRSLERSTCIYSMAIPSTVELISLSVLFQVVSLATIPQTALDVEYASGVSSFASFVLFHSSLIRLSCRSDATFCLLQWRSGPCRKTLEHRRRRQSHRPKHSPDSYRSSGCACLFRGQGLADERGSRWQRSVVSSCSWPALSRSNKQLIFCACFSGRL